MKAPFAAAQSAAEGAYLATKRDLAFAVASDDLDQARILLCRAATLKEVLKDIDRLSCRWEHDVAPLLTPDGAVPDAPSPATLPDVVEIEEVAGEAREDSQAVQRCEEPAEAQLLEAPADAGEPPAKPDHAAVREHRTSSAEFVRQASAILGETAWDGVQQARAKACACRGRRTLAIGHHLGVKSPHVDRKLSELRISLGAKMDEFHFAFGNGWTLRSQDWAEVGQAYDLLAVGEQAIAKGMDAFGKSRREALESAAACGAVLFRCLSRLGLPPDVQQGDLKVRIEALKSEDHFIRCWLSHDKGGPTDSEVRHQADRLPSLLASLPRSTAVAGAKKAALEALDELVRRPGGDDHIEDQIDGAVLACLSSGVPPSDTRLRALALPFIDILDFDHPQKPKLVDYLRKDANQSIVDHLSPDLADDFVDEDHERKLEVVQGLMRGKVCLFVGGSKGQTRRKSAIVSALGLKRLDWPDVEKSTNPVVFEACVRKADVVCLIVRFSRKGYKAALEDAERQGKPAIRLRAGLGIHRIVHDIYGQLAGDAVP